MHNKKRFNWKAALKLLLILAAVYVVVVSCVIFFGDIYELVFLDERRNAYDTSESNNTSTPFTSATPTILPTQTSSPTQPADPSQTIGPTPTADPTQTTVPTQTTNPAQTTGPKPTTDLQPTATPAPTSTPVPVFNPPVEDDCLPEKFAGFKYDIILNDKVVNSYVKEDSIFFPSRSIRIFRESSPSGAIITGIRLHMAPRISSRVNLKKFGLKKQDILISGPV